MWLLFWGMTKEAHSLAPRVWLVVYHGYPSGMKVSSSVLASSVGVYWVGICGGTQIDKGGRGWYWLHSPLASVFYTWLSYGPCSWLCGSGEMRMLSGLTGGSLVHSPPLERQQCLVALTRLFGETRQTLGT